MMELQIRHIGYDEEKPIFSVRAGATRFTEVRLTPPNQFIVEPHGINLQNALRWLLDDYLEMPIEPNKLKASSVLNALASWGSDCYSKLFEIGFAVAKHKDQIKTNPNISQITIESESPAILS